MLEELLVPVDMQQILNGRELLPHLFGNSISIWEEGNIDLEPLDIAIIGIPEGRGTAINKDCENAPNHIRRSLYFLSNIQHHIKAIDLGDLRVGNSQEDTYVAVVSILEELISNKVLPIILGGSHDLTLAQFQAYENLKKTLSVAVVDERIDLIEDERTNNSSFLMNIFTHEPNYLFNYAHLGYQSYFVDPNILNTLERLSFDSYRLGYFRPNVQKAEPIIRDADLLSIDISSIKQADAPANANATPNGFTSEEISQIVKYAGMSDRLSSIGFYEVNPAYDQNYQTSMLVAQMIWIFIEGVYNRKQDFPLKDKKNFTKFIVEANEGEHTLQFWKSKKSGRWWIEVPVASNIAKYNRHQLVSCSYDDYQEALKGEVPDQWIKFYQKFG